MSGNVLVPISIGELFDKITVLEIKSKKIVDPAKLINVNYELQILSEIAESMIVSDPQKLKVLFLELKDVNLKIWEAEDKIRSYEHSAMFGENFVETARSIYRLNDIRAAIKRALSILTSSQIIEEKNYAGSSDL